MLDQKSQATCGTRLSYYRCFLPDLTGFITSTLRRAWQQILYKTSTLKANQLHAAHTPRKYLMEHVLLSFPPKIIGQSLHLAMSLPFP